MSDKSKPQYIDIPRIVRDDEHMYWVSRSPLFRIALSQGMRKEDISQDILERFLRYDRLPGSRFNPERQGRFGYIKLVALTGLIACMKKHRTQTQLFAPQESDEEEDMSGDAGLLFSPDRRREENDLLQYLLFEYASDADIMIPQIDSGMLQEYLETGKITHPNSKHVFRLNAWLRDRIREYSLLASEQVNPDE